MYLDHTHWFLLKKKKNSIWVSGLREANSGEMEPSSPGKSARRDAGFLWHRIFHLRVSQLWPPCCHKVFFIEHSCIYSLICLLFSCSVVPNKLRPPWTAAHQIPCPSESPRICSNSCALSQWYHPTISSSVIPLFSCFQSFQNQVLFQWVSSSYQVAKVLELHLQHQSFQWIFRIDFL